MKPTQDLVRNRINEIRKYARSVNENEKLYFEIHARPMVWELLTQLEEAAKVIEDLMPNVEEYIDKVGGCGCGYPSGYVCPADRALNFARDWLKKYRGEK